MIEPDFSSVALEIGGKTIRPVRVIPVADGGTRVDDLVVTIRKDRVRAIRATDGAEAWASRSKDGQYLQLVAAERQMLFVQNWQKYNKSGREQYQIANPGEIQRLSTKDGTWLDPLVTGPLLPNGRTMQTAAVVTAANHVLVLEAEQGDSDLHEVQLHSYRVSCFAGSDRKPIWQKKYQSAGAVPSVGVGILFQGDPLYAKSQLRMLSLVGDILIVCAGAAEDIFALEIPTGDEKWRLPAVWEFQRGFIGPSVWQYFISRFGVDDLPDDKELEDISSEAYKNEVRDTRMRLDKEKIRLAKTCRIVGGPAAILLPQAMREHHGIGTNRGVSKSSEPYRLFVAVAEAAGDYGGYLADCRMYEIDDSGKPIAVVNMPRMVHGSLFGNVQDGGVIWRCDEGAVAKLVPSRQSRGIGMGPGGSDCIARLAWYVQPDGDPGEPDLLDAPNPHWLAWSLADDPVAFDGDVMFRLALGGYINEAEDRVMCLPISRTVLPGGDPKEITLRIPFKGQAKTPTSNYSSSRDRFFSYRPLYMSIVNLDARSGNLMITVSSEDGNQTMLFFDVSLHFLPNR